MINDSWDVTVYVRLIVGSASYNIVPENTYHIFELPKQQSNLELLQLTHF